MPTYQYRCQDCSRDLEIFQKFTDDSLTICPECQGSLRKVFNAVGVVFKGSGFYKTDSRGADPKAAKPETSSASADKSSTSSTPATNGSSNAASTGSSAPTSSAGKASA